MNIFITPKFKKGYDKLPMALQRKVEKATNLLKSDISYPSLRVKKMTGKQDTWEARVDKSYRMTFEKEGNALILQTVGPHDEGLGKK